METLSFDLLPKEVARIHSRLDSLEYSIQRLADGGIPPTTGDLLTVEQAAELLHLSIQTIYGLLHRRELPSLKRGKRVYFKKEDLLQYLEDGRRNAQDAIDHRPGSITKSYKKGGAK